jgi:hypothetical protein
VGLCVEIGRLLHSRGLIERTFGRPIPVIVHELEYYEEIAAQTELANPPNLASDLVAWVGSL